MCICFEGETKRNVEEKVQRNVIQLETAELGSVHVLLFDIGNRPFSSSDGYFAA